MQPGDQDLGAFRSDDDRQAFVIGFLRPSIETVAGRERKTNHFLPLHRRAGLEPVVEAAARCPGDRLGVRAFSELAPFSTRRVPTEDAETAQAASSVWRTFRISTSSVYGVCRKATWLTSTACRVTASSVKPLV